MVPGPEMRRSETDTGETEKKQNKIQPTNLSILQLQKFFFFFAGSECAENAIHGLNSYSRLVKVFYLPDSQCDYGCELPR